MKTISKFLIFTLVLILVSLGTISATENITDNTDSITDSTTDIINDNPNTNVLEDTSTITNEKIIEKNEKNTTIKQASQTITVTNATYSQYFKPINKSEFVETTSLIQSGDTVNLKGNFNNVKFAVDKKITFTSINKDAKLENCTVYVLGQNATGSTISNLNIFNDGTLIKGIQVKNASNLIIENNHIKTLGLRSYGFVADNMNHSTIRNNYFEREGDDWRYITFVMGVCYYNNIANNTLLTGGANGIYFSIYGSYEAQFEGGQCDYNNITGNNITARGYVTSWCYTIQVMGAYNLVSNNTVQGGFRGISTQDYENNIITNNDVHAINEGIYACEGASVYNNNVHVTGNSNGITIGSEDVKIFNNTITSEDGNAIEIKANNVLIANNTINTNSIGIYAKGTYEHIIIDNNHITSKKEGILFKHQTRYKKMNHILVNKNTITSTEADYAIDFLEVGSLTTSEINVTVTDSNGLYSRNASGNNAYLKPSNSNDTTLLDSNQKIILTPANYTQWFTNGIANNNIEQNATIYFNGTFNNQNFTFNKKVHIIGQNSQINEGTITFTADAHASTVKDLTINNKQTDTTKHAIELLEVNNCEITNININNYAEYESIGIFLYGSNGNKITNNKITTSGDYVNNGILLYGSDINTIENNKVNLNQSNKQIQYDDSIMFNEKIGTIQEVLHNHGIMLVYSNTNTINKNNINATSMFKTYTFPTADCRNSMVGIDIYFESDNNKVTNNNINVTGYGPYNYGIGVLGGQWGTSILSTNSTNNLYENNNVNVTGGYFATGFIAGRNSVNTTLKNNNITVNVYKNSTNRGDYAHGVTLENSTSSNIINNTITSTASSIYSIELFDSGSNQIINNTIKATGTYPYGIAGTRASENNIQNNTFTITKTNYGPTSQATHSESIESGEEGIMLTSTSKNNNIQYNTIKTNTNSTIKLTDETSNNNVTENSLTANKTVADQSVTSQHPSNIVKNNFVYFVNVTVDSFSAMTGDTVTLVAHVNTTTTDYKNLSVSFKIGATVVGNASVVNGKSTLSYNIPSYFNPTTYTVVANVGGINFQNASGSAYANIGKIAQPVRVDVARVSSVIGGKVNLEANITTLTGGKIGAGQAVFYLDGKRLEAIDVKLGNAVSKNQPVGNNPGIYNITVLYTGGGYDYLDGQGSNLLTVQSPTTITVYDYVAGLGDEVVFKLPIVSGGRNVTTGNARILIAGKVIGNVTASNGLIYYKYVIPTSYNKGVLDYSVVYDGNSTIGGASGTGKLTVNPFSSEILYNSTSATVGSQVSLTVAINNGRSGSRFFAADGGNVAVKLNGKTLTDSNGKAITGNVVNGSIVFKFTATEQLVGTHNLTFDYAGNNKFAQKSKTFTNGLTINKKTTTPTNNTNTTKPTTNTTTPTVARATIITIDTVKDVNYLGKTKITGVFKDEIGTILYNSNILASVNGKSFTVKTDSKGVYSFDAEATRAGKNFVSVYFRGNSLFKPSSNSVTFLSLNTPTIITINGVKNGAYQGKTRVTGTFKDAAGNLLFNSNVLASVNGKSFTVKTDSKGVFSFDADASLVGKNFISVYFRGNSLYKPSSNTVNFIAYDAPTVITINPISTVSYGSNVKITGTFKDVAGNILFNSNVMISVNGKSYTVKTDSKGVFTLTAKANLAGKNFVSVYFRGNTIYRATSTSLTFIANNVGTNITINKINTVKQGNNVVISGSFKDAAGNRMFNSTVTLKLNNKTYKVKTDSYGNFKYTTKDTILGTNTVQISSTANSIYKATTTTTKFNVIK